MRGTLEGGAAAAAALAGRALAAAEDPQAGGGLGAHAAPEAQGILGLYTGGALAPKAQDPASVVPGWAPRSWTSAMTSTPPDARIR